MTKRKGKADGAPAKAVPGTVAAILDEAQRQAAVADGLDPDAVGPNRDYPDEPRNPSTGGETGEGTIDDENGEPGTRPKPGAAVDMEVVAHCAGLDHSDTDNAERLIAHFGDDLLVLAQAKARKAAYAVWTGTHWDIDTGDARALAVAQQLGGRIALESTVLKMTEAEQRDFDRAKDARAKDGVDLTPIEQRMIAKAEKAAEAYRKRVARRMTHAVSSKNKGRLEAMLACAAPHIMRGPDEFNANPLKVAVAGHTLSFRKVQREEPNPDFTDPDVSREDVPPTIRRTAGEVTAAKGHMRRTSVTGSMRSMKASHRGQAAFAS